ncbi:hypothetical protein [Klebsiella aerogenes]|uniref:hypothetical protein n=2 Tax=Gammaproteobacteria TaxID=1236 RepID=UPI0037A48F0F
MKCQAFVGIDVPIVCFYRQGFDNCVTLSGMEALTPVHASLVADLVALINENLGALLVVKTITCPDCKGAGTVGGEPRQDGTVFDDGTLITCATCGGVGAIEHYTLDQAKLQAPRYGRLIEGFEFKQGQYVPKFRSKTTAFTTLVKLLGFDKAVVEIANAAPLTQTLSQEQRDQYIEQLKELAQMNLLK